MRRLALLLALCALATPSARQAPPAGDIVIEKNVEARMRDGVVLRADVYRPVSPGRRPALLQRTPYSKNPEAPDSQFHRLARAGFVVVVQDTRGRYMSDGVAVPHDEGADGYDTVEWVAQLPYVDGRVGMFGGSYSATVQLLAAPLRPPHLVALFPSASYASRYDMVFQGGAFYLGDGLSWSLGQAKDVRRRMLEPKADRDGELGLTPEERKQLQGEWYRHLPLSSIEALQIRRYSPGYFDLLQHPSYDAFWTTFDVAAKTSAVFGARLSPDRLVRQPAERHARQLQRPARQCRHVAGAGESAPHRRSVDACAAHEGDHEDRGRGVRPRGRLRFRRPHRPLVPALDAHAYRGSDPSQA